MTDADIIADLAAAVDCGRPVNAGFLLRYDAAAVTRLLNSGAIVRHGIEPGVVVVIPAPKEPKPTAARQNMNGPDHGLPRPGPKRH